MSRIKILSETLANKIAAGEVVERPASVVKELVENAIDAGSDDIIVEIEVGGKRLIRVSDSGCGMSREDALLSLERHATSKIKGEDDIGAISTLGFRGEALPAIASVSKFTLATKESALVEGTEIYAEGGSVREVKACGMADGTVVTVRSLFFNTPARMKFLKSPQTESGHIGELMSRFILARPDLRVTYIQDGNAVYKAPPGSLQDRLPIVLGGETASGLYPVEVHENKVAVKGFVSRPDCCRSTSSAIYTYINGRFVRDKVVQHAIMEAYRPLLEKGRYPVVVLHIALSPEEVDVNVHPTKHEVRFREQGEVHDAIRDAVVSTLRSTPWLTRKTEQKSAGATRVAEVRETLERYGTSLQAGKKEMPAPLFQTKPVFRASSTPPPAQTQIQEPPEQDQSDGYFSSLSIIGQYHDAYIICQAENELVIIDQHAAHERVAFEQLKEQYGQGGIESQSLIFPETTEWSFSEAATVRDSLPYLSRLGFDLEHFGGNTFILKSMPRLLAGHDHQRTLREIIEELSTVGKSVKYEEAVEELLATVACHSVVRGKRSLSTSEMKALLRQMDSVAFSTSCPHGRPVSRILTHSEVERMFKR